MLSRFEQFFDEGSIVGQEQQPFRIGIEPAGGINSLWYVKFGESSLALDLRCELAQNAVGLIKNNVAKNGKE